MHVCKKSSTFALEIGTRFRVFSLYNDSSNIFNQYNNRMKTKNILWLLVSLFLLVVPAAQISASDEEVEIVLMEVSGFLPGDNPLDNPEQEGNNPPHPLDFRATITGRTLEITSGTHDARVIVRNSSNMQVLDRQFVGGTVEQLPAAGNYSLEIQSGSLTLVGVFEAE